MESKESKDIPPDLEQHDTVKALDDSLLHLSNCLCTTCFAKLCLCSTPILLNEVELTVVFGIEVAQVAMRLNKFLKLRFLPNKVSLREKEAAAATVSAPRGALEIRTLGN
jgi:hypothetical protein